MKAVRRFLCLAVIPVLIANSSCRKSEDRITGEIKNIAGRFVPDKRTAIFSVEVKEGSGNKVILKGETTVPAARDSLFKRLNNEYNNISDSILILPDTSGNRKYRGLVSLSVINLRKEPDHASELVSQAILGSPLLILKEDDGWLMVQTPDKYISWTENSSVRKTSPGEMNVWKNSDRMVYLGNTGWIYANPARTSVIGDIVAGGLVAKTGETGDFFRVVLPDGREGFIEKAFLEPFSQFIKDTTSGDGIIKRAESMLGIPYLWGGSSPKGADCSGFVQNVFFMNGMIVQRDASQQAMHGHPVDISANFSNLRAGDLLFFGSENRITHVAIYKGDTEFIHSSGRVMINSLDSTRNNYSPYRRSTLRKALRIIGNEDEGIVRLKAHKWF
ncbi:MAG TPA: NlpC/P60 family protein [Bacteroidales bacterium]|nr:NlpC/P60 family protein [Bacteroidales bacterium]